MKRALFDTVAVLPFTSGSIIPRLGYASAVLAVTVASKGKAVVTAEHCDTADGTFTAVADSRLFLDNPVEDGAAVIANDTAAEIVANLNIDLTGCKAFVKLTVTGGEAGALAPGDAARYPAHRPAAAAPPVPASGGEAP